MSKAEKKYIGVVSGGSNSEAEGRKKCGIIMPISNTNGYPDGHWAEVKSILTEAIDSAGYSARLVSDSDDSTIIHKSIIQNIYQDEIVVCDVSSRNPNVMFELGMRLTFDKPVVIVKDERTPYSFDTSNIEHIEYTSDLRFNGIVHFKERLMNKIISTAKSKPSFLSLMGTFEVPKINTEKVEISEYIIGRMESMDRQVREIKSILSNSAHQSIFDSHFEPSPFTVRIDAPFGMVKGEEILERIPMRRVSLSLGVKGETLVKVYPNKLTPSARQVAELISEISDAKAAPTGDVEIVDSL